MDTLGILFGVLAGIIQVCGYWIYNRKLAKNEIRPNVTSWAIWGIGSFIAYALYSDLANDWVKEFLPLVCAIAAVATFVHMAVRGSFQKPDRTDVQIFALDIAVVSFWIYSNDPILSNVLLELDIWISFAPILRSTWKHPETEDATPWKLWSVAYLLFTIAVIMRWEKWWDLLLPLNYLVLHVAIWAFTKFRTAKT